MFFFFFWLFHVFTFPQLLLMCFVIVWNVVFSDVAVAQEVKPLWFSFSTVAMAQGVKPLGHRLSHYWGILAAGVPAPGSSLHVKVSLGKTLNPTNISQRMHQHCVNASFPLMSRLAPCVQPLPSVYEWIIIWDFSVSQIFATWFRTSCILLDFLFNPV